MMDNETQADRLAKVDSILKDTHRAMKRAMLEAETMTAGYRRHRKQGAVRAYGLVLDAFAEAGFEVRSEG